MAGRLRGPPPSLTKPTYGYRSRYRYNPRTYIWEMKVTDGPWKPMYETVTAEDILDEFRKNRQDQELEECISPRIDYDTFGHSRNLRHQEYQECITPRPPDYEMFDLRPQRQQEEPRTLADILRKEYRREFRRIGKLIKSQKRANNLNPFPPDRPATAGQRKSRRKSTRNRRRKSRRKSTNRRRKSRKSRRF